MSTFTNYDSVAASDYDVARLPIGADIMEKFIRKNSPADYEKTSLVDFGTGTGSYIVELLKSGMKFAMCTDFSQIMLDKCEAKLLKGGFDERFGVKKVCLPNSGFDNDEFDAAKCSMVIHHLVKTNENGVVDDWSPIGDAFSEAHRVLKPGGVFVVAFSTPEQRGGNWYAHLVPDTRARTIARCPSKEKVRELFQAAGFQVADEEVMTNHYCSNETYYDHEIFLKNQRAWFMDSVLSSATEEELAAAKAKVNELAEKNELKKFLEDHDDFKNFGCGTIIAGVKALSSSAGR